MRPLDPDPARQKREDHQNECENIPGLDQFTTGCQSALYAKPDLRTDAEGIMLLVSKTRGFFAPPPLRRALHSSCANCGRGVMMIVASGVAGISFHSLKC